MRSRHVGRSVLIGTVTPNRNGRVPPVVLEPVIACPFVARIGARLVVQRGAVDEFLDAAVERSALDDVDELVGCPLEEGGVELFDDSGGISHGRIVGGAGLRSNSPALPRAYRQPLPSPRAFSDFTLRPSEN